MQTLDITQSGNNIFEGSSKSTQHSLKIVTDQQNLLNTSGISKEDSKPSSNSNCDPDECLGYQSNYVSQIEQKEELLKQNSNSNSSTNPSNSPKTKEPSTNFTNSPYNNYNRSNQMNFYTNARKMSSPMCSYYQCSTTFLSEMFEKTANPIDYTKSNNFIKKDTIRAKYSNQVPTTPTNNQMYEPQQMFYNNLEGYDRDQNKKRTVSFNGINDFTNLALNKLNPFNVKYSGKPPAYSIFCPKNVNTNINISNTSSNNNHKHKPFAEREGDWVCSRCKNLNFAFRVVCNRCRLQKSESEKANESNKKTEAKPLAQNYNNKCK